MSGVLSTRALPRVLDGDAEASGGNGSPERERKRLDARIEELDLELAVGDGLRLPDQLIQPLPGQRAVALFVDVHSVRRAQPDVARLSRQASSGNDMDGYADDLAAVIEALDLREVTVVGHSTGGGEVARYIGRHGTRRVAKAVLIAAVPPLVLKTPANPEGLPIELFDGLRASLAKDRSQLYKDFAPQFYGANRPGAKVSQGVLDQFWIWSMQSGLKNAYESIKAFSETDFTEDLKKFDVPTLVLHGEDDQVVPVRNSAMKSARLIKGAKDIYYPSAPHGLTATHQDQVNQELLAFLTRGN
jgi:non-heme chloroperoxidase